VGDIILVPVGDLEVPTVAAVIAVHKEANIHPDSTIRYKWAGPKVNLEAFLENAKGDQDFEDRMVDARKEADKEAARIMLEKMFGGGLPALPGSPTDEKTEAQFVDTPSPDFTEAAPERTPSANEGEASGVDPIDPVR